MSDTPMKRCSKCGEEFLATREYFYSCRNGDNNGLHAWCKACFRQNQKQHRIVNADEINRLRSERAVNDPEYRERRNESLRKSWQKHKAKRNAEQREYWNEQTQDPQWVTENKRKRRESQMRRLQDPQKREVRRKRDRERKRERRVTDPAFADKSRQISRKRYYNNPNRADVARTAAALRRSRNKSRPVNFTKADWQRCLEYFDGRCAVCGKSLIDSSNERAVAADHWIPLASDHCPGTVPGNIVPLCNGKGGCNNSKHANEPMKWLIRRFGEKRAEEILDRIEAYFEWVANH